MTELIEGLGIPGLFAAIGGLGIVYTHVAQLIAGDLKPGQGSSGVPCAVYVAFWAMLIGGGIWLCAS